MKRYDKASPLNACLVLFKLTDHNQGQHHQIILCLRVRFNGAAEYTNLSVAWRNENTDIPSLSECRLQFKSAISNGQATGKEAES